MILLWAATDVRKLSRRRLFESIAIFCVACAIGLIAFSPVFETAERRAPLGFLAVLPLLWSALRRSPRDTATSALVLAAFAVWGTLAGSGPFGRDTLNESFLLLLMFMIGVTVPSLALSADAAARRRSENALRAVQEDLNRRVAARTADLTEANLALQDEIDRRKHAEAVLDRQTRHLVEAQRLANLGSWVRNLETNEIVWSDQLYEIFGVQRGEENSGTFDGYLKRIHPDDRDRVREQVQAAIKAGRDFQGDRRIVRPNGEVRHVQTCVELIKNDAGRVVSMHGICFDVTERKQAEIELERTREQLAQMQKMEALGQLTGGIAHDFNNLLMIVSGHAELLRRKLTDPKPAARASRRSWAPAAAASSLTRQLLTFSRRQPLKPVPIDLSQRVQAMRPMLNSSLRGNIALAIELPDDLWPVEADVAEFELAMVNLAVNARDAMPDGGTFTISARNVPAGEGNPGQPSTDHVAHFVRRHRRRHPAGHRQEDLRSVLHHQGGGQGHRAGPVAGLRLCPSVRRNGQRDQRGRARHHDHAVPRPLQRGGAGVAANRRSEKCGARGRHHSRGRGQSGGRGGVRHAARTDRLSGAARRRTPSRR